MTAEEARGALEALYRRHGSWHPDDDPADVVDLRTGDPLLTDDEADEARAVLDRARSAGVDVYGVALGVLKADTGEDWRPEALTRDAATGRVVPGTEKKITAADLTCRSCGEIPHALTSAPVVVTISDNGIATVSVDLTDLVGDLQEGEARCGCTPGAPVLEEYDGAFLGALQEVADRVAPSVDYDLQCWAG